MSRERSACVDLQLAREVLFSVSLACVHWVGHSVFFPSFLAQIPWESLLYVIGEINYGGRVTDSWDRRCLLAILRRFFRPELLDDSFTFSESGLYRAPSDGPLESYVEYVEALSREDPPEVFGMHENANITNQRQESNRMFTTIMSIQPRIGASGGGASEEELAFDMAESACSVDRIYTLHGPLNMGFSCIFCPR